MHALFTPLQTPEPTLAEPAVPTSDSHVYAASRHSSLADAPLSFLRGGLRDWSYNPASGERVPKSNQREHENPRSIMKETTIKQ
jgi:hypothetical protein